MYVNVCKPTRYWQKRIFKTGNKESNCLFRNGHEKNILNKDRSGRSREWWRRERGLEREGGSRGAGYLCRMTLVATRTAGVCGRRRWANGSDESWRRQGPHTAGLHHSLCNELPVSFNQRNSNQTEGLHGYHRQLYLCSFQLWACGERDQHLKTMLSDAYSASAYFA